MNQQENSTSAVDSMSAQQALDLFLTPPRKLLPEREQALLDWTFDKIKTQASLPLPSAEVVIGKSRDQTEQY